MGRCGTRDFKRKYGVIETVEKITESENSCSKNSKKMIQILRKPGCSPMLFGNHLMNSTAFVSLEDIATALPSYTESVLEVDAAGELGKAYEDLAEQIKQTIKSYPKDKGLRSIMLNTLLCYPDHPHGWDTIYRKMFDRKACEYVTIKVAEPNNLEPEAIYPKERELIATFARETCRRPQMPSLRNLHGQARRCGTLEQNVEWCWLSRCCATLVRCDRQARGVVCEAS